MRWLALAILAEGPTDERFLTHVLYRQVMSLLEGSAAQPVEVQEYVIKLDGSDRSNDARIERICAASDTFDLLALHADASRSNRSLVNSNIVAPIIAGVSLRCDLDPVRIVPMLPAPEMEAWASCDPDAIARCCGLAAWPRSRAGAPIATALERRPDAKKSLNEAIESLTGKRRVRRDRTASAIFDRLGLEIDLDKLARLRSFREFSEALRSSLRRLGYLG